MGTRIQQQNNVCLFRMPSASGVDALYPVRNYSSNRELAPDNAGKTCSTSPLLVLVQPPLGCGDRCPLFTPPVNHIGGNSCAKALGNARHCMPTSRAIRSPHAHRNTKPSKATSSLNSTNMYIASFFTQNLAAHLIPLLGRGPGQTKAPQFCMELQCLSFVITRNLAISHFPLFGSRRRSNNSHYTTASHRAST